jgi:hypothetical protein
VGNVENAQSALADRWPHVNGSINGIFTALSQRLPVGARLPDQLGAMDGRAARGLKSPRIKMEQMPMRASTDRILTTHVGSLPRPDALIAANAALAGTGSAAAQQEALRGAVIDVVGRQRAAGVDLPNDGEFGKAVTHRVNYGAWWNYAFDRWSGIRGARGRAKSS